MLVFNSIAVLTLRWRLPARKNAPWLDFSALTDRVFALSALAMYFANGALYFAFCYVCPSQHNVYETGVDIG